MVRGEPRAAVALSIFLLQVDIEAQCNVCTEHTWSKGVRLLVRIVSGADFGHQVTKAPD